MNAIVIAPGESLTREQCDAVVGAGLIVAVCDAYRMIEHCYAICATDRAWWRARTEVMSLPCRKFSVHEMDGIERVERNDHIGTDSSSGVLGLWVAKLLGAKRILMLGFDNRGGHFFGPYVPPLKNTAPHRFATFAHQFTHLRNRFKLDGIECINCTPGTALEAFPKLTLEEGLEWISSKSAA